MAAILRPFRKEVRMDASTLDYAVTVAGMDDWSGAGPKQASLPLPFPDAPAPTLRPDRTPDSISGVRLGPTNGPDGRRQTAQLDTPSAVRKAPDVAPVRTGRTTAPLPRRRFTAREQRLRAMNAGQYAQTLFVTDRPKAMKPSSVGQVSDMLSHLVRAKAGVAVKDLGDELLYEFRDYWLEMVGSGDSAAATANKHIRQLRAVCNHAAEARLVKRIRFNRFLPEKEPQPFPLDDRQRAAIERRCRELDGDVCGVSAAVWWFAWWRTIGYAGCRVSAMMLARRGDVQNGVLWLRKENQKQGKHQKIALPRLSTAAVQLLLESHDRPMLFPWPFDQASYTAAERGEKTNWNVLYKHFRKKLLTPCGIVLPKGILTRIGRRTAATLANDNGGSGQHLCGHSSPKTTRHYVPDDHVPITRDALCIPEPAEPAIQLALFQKEAG
jgi:integrase